ncbi:ribonuclease P protein component [Campylobacter portucalensis]|uniref:ribonuclease P protein component n=1 Tax=Campylobacter portucalensis TaxID=2608384 RepID=UPI002DD91778|nr:ribonuclease P protein component [Campylobacter portucalensis]
MYQKANKWHCECAVIYFLEDRKCRFAVVASKKVGNAVKRNRAKRVMREILLKMEDDLKFGSFVFIAKKDINSMKFIDIYRNFKWSFKKLKALK